MVMRPPSGMASRALRQRFSSAFSSCAGVDLGGHRPPAPTTSTRRRADRAADQVLHAGDQPVDVGRLGIERLAPGEGEQPLRQRGRALGGALRCADVAFDARRAGPWRVRLSSSSRLPLIPASRLLKSCAMPPVSWPTASIFCACRRASWAVSQLLFGGLLVGDVAAGAIDHAILRNADPGNPAVAAVLAAVAVGKTDGGLAGLRQGEPGPGPLDIVGVEHARRSTCWRPPPPTSRAPSSRRDWRFRNSPRR